MAYGERYRRAAGPPDLQDRLVNGPALGRLAVHRQHYVAGEDAGRLRRRALDGSDDDYLVGLLGNGGADTLERATGKDVDAVGVRVHVEGAGV